MPITSACAIAHGTRSGSWARAVASSACSTARTAAGSVDAARCEGSDATAASSSSQSTSDFDAK